MVKCHYDKMLLGKTACGRTNYDLASEDIKQVTCKSCLRKKVRPTKRAADGYADEGVDTSVIYEASEYMRSGK